MSHRTETVRCPYSRRTVRRAACSQAPNDIIHEFLTVAARRLEICDRAGYGRRGIVRCLTKTKIARFRWWRNYLTAPVAFVTEVLIIKRNCTVTMRRGQSIYQSMYLSKCNKHWTGHKEMMQPPLTDASKNNVSKSKKRQHFEEKKSTWQKKCSNPTFTTILNNRRLKLEILTANPERKCFELFEYCPQLISCRKLSKTVDCSDVLCVRGTTCPVGCW